MSSSNWSATRISADMYNVYLGDNYAGYVARSASITHGTVHGWIAAAELDKGTSYQRTPRSSAYQAARDMWGPEAGEAVTTSPQK